MANGLAVGQGEWRAMFNATFELYGRLISVAFDNYDYGRRRRRRSSTKPIERAVGS